MKIKGNPNVPARVRKVLRKQFSSTSTKKDENDPYVPTLPRRTFAFKKGDLVSVKKEYIPDHLPTDGLVVEVDETKSFFDVLLGTENLRIWGGHIKYSISR